MNKHPVCFDKSTNENSRPQGGDFYKLRVHLWMQQILDTSLCLPCLFLWIFKLFTDSDFIAGFY
jgi:hypothetical protein